MHFKLNTALLFAATASALQVTSPTKGTKLDLSKSNELTWSSVESDPTSFDIELVNEHINPPVAKTIATNVQTSAGSYTFNSMSAAVGEGYQINLISNEQQNTGILAQSPNFEVSGASGTSSTVSATFTTTTSSDSSTSSDMSSSTLTSTATATGLTTMSMSQSSASMTASGTATKTASASSSGVSSSATSQPSTGAANAMGVSAAVGGILGGGVLAFLM